ncbi:hypothetical protein PO909_013475 [Leuciscus waleckii]
MAGKGVLRPPLPLGESGCIPSRRLRLPERVEETGERSLAEKGAFQDFESSAWSSGRKGADLEAGACQRLGRKHPSSLLGAGAFGGDHLRPSCSTALVRRRRSSASTLARARPDSWVEEEVERCDPDHSSLSEARREQLSPMASSSASSPEATAVRAGAGRCASGKGGGEGESEARGRGSGEHLAGTSGSGGLCERRFFLRDPAETGGVTASASNKASRARRVDISSSSQSTQPPEDRARAAWSRPRQRTQITSRSLSLSGARQEPQEMRGILQQTPRALLGKCVAAESPQRKHSKKDTVAG